MLALTREMIYGHLEKVSSLIDLYQNRDYVFIEKTIIWLTEVEKTLARLRHSLASYVAIERGKIIAVADGYQDPSIILSDRRSKRKTTFATALVILCNVESTLMDVINKIDEQFQTWQEKMVQFLAVASTEVAIPLPPTEPRQKWLNEIWSSLGKTEKAKNMFNYLNSAMKPTDRLFLLNFLMENMVETSRNI